MNSGEDLFHPSSFDLHPSLRLLARGNAIDFPRRPLVMGILNLGADSFSGDGIIDLEAAVERGRQIVAAGADILDVGAESARTNRAAISEQEEIDQLGGFIRIWRKQEASRSALLSINTWRPAVVRAVLAEGGDILNDIGALPTDENARICAEFGAALLIMHSKGAPKIAHTHIQYADVLEEMDRFFGEKIQLAIDAGLPKELIILDPGIDFAKQRADNLRIYHQLGRLHKFGRPILLPVSRKTVIGEVLAIKEPSERDAGTVACIAAGMNRGASIFRVHNVEAALQSIKMLWAMSCSGGPPV